jgi:antitoxin component HigA of HigAB toxin-antitoxin module
MTNGHKNNNRTLPDTYFALVKQFPLAHIRDDDHLAAASAVIDRLLQHELDEGEQEYLSVLTDMVEAYEGAHVPIRDASEADVLRELMRGLGGQALIVMIVASIGSIQGLWSVRCC